jgi:hypothetical protein
MMKNLVLVLVLAACGPKQTTPVSNAGDADPPGPVRDTRTEIERRRDTACETLGPRITACAVEDAKREIAAGRVTQKDFDANTAPEVQRKNTEKFVEACQEQSYSSRQVRVLEVCPQEESQCEPMLACLDNLNQQENK